MIHPILKMGDPRLLHVAAPVTGFNTPELDKVLDATRTAVDPAEREKVAVGAVVPADAGPAGGESVDAEPVVPRDADVGGMSGDADPAAGRPVTRRWGIIGLQLAWLATFLTVAGTVETSGAGSVSPF